MILAALEAARRTIGMSLPAHGRRLARVLPVRQLRHRRQLAASARVGRNGGDDALCLDAGSVWHDGGHRHARRRHLRHLWLAADGYRRRQRLHARRHPCCRPDVRRTGKSRGSHLGPVRHHLRVRGRQRDVGRDHHDPDHDPRRLPPGFCRRHRGQRVGGWPDHAPGDGRWRIHHGRAAQYLLCLGCHRGGYPGHPLFQRDLLQHRLLRAR